MMVIEAEQRLSPADALKLLRRLRSIGPCKISVQFDAHTVTDDSRHMMLPAILDGVTMQQATNYLEDMQRIADTIREVSDHPPLIPIKVHGGPSDNAKSVVLG
jgi:hypothetical protein